MNSNPSEPSKPTDQTKPTDQIKPLDQAGKPKPPSDAPKAPKYTFGETQRVDGKGSETAKNSDSTSVFSSGLSASGQAKKHESWVGKKLGKYEITGVLGSGGMGIVLKGHDPLIDREVAIKILPDEVAANPAMLNRFLGEARAVGKLTHPNVTAIYQIDQEEGFTYLVMEYVDGGNLADLMEKNGAFSVLEATRIAIDVCKGLTAAHAADLIHRDIKPANLLRGSDKVVKIADFGLVKSTSPTAPEVTQAGAVVGTPYFMSPEQCQSVPLDARSDIYSLGATYYCLLTGQQPYQESDSIVQIMYSHCHGPVPDPRLSNERIPMACSAIIKRAMAKSPEMRYATAAQMQKDLEAVAATLSGEMPIALPSQSNKNLPPLSGVKSGVQTDPSTVALKSLPPPTTDSTGTNSQTANSPATNSSGTNAQGAIVNSFPSSSKSGRPYFYAGLVLAFLLLSFVGWKLFQGSQGGENEADKGEKSAIKPPSGEPIKVGILHSISGTMAASSSVVIDATIFAIDEINQKGGVLGRPIKAVVADGRSQDEVYAREARRLITEEKVVSVFGCWTSSGRKTVKPIFEELDHLLLYPVQYEGLESSPNIFYFGSAPNQQIIPAVEYAVRTMKKKKFFLVGSDYVFPRTANEIIKDVLKKEGGTIAGEAYLVLGSQDVQTIVDRIIQSQPDMILNTINGDTNTAFFRALRQKGYTADRLPTLSFSIGEQELRQFDQTQFQGDYAAWTYFESLDNPQNQKFVEAFHERLPHLVITDPMEAAYASVKLWAQAVEEAQSTDPKEVRRALRNQRLLSPGGMTRVDPETQHCFKTPRIGKILDNGQFQVIWSAPEPMAPRPFPNSRTTAEWKAFLVDLYSHYGNRWSAK